MITETYRRITQFLSSILLMFPVLSQFKWTGFAPRWVCTPVMNCHGCQFSHFSCPIGVLLHYPGQFLTIPFLIIGTVLVLGGLFGRFLCGWICPMGLLQDLLYKIPTPKFRIPGWMGYGKYAALIGLVILVPWFAATGYASSWTYCQTFCPTAGLQVTIPTIYQGDYKLKLEPTPITNNVISIPTVDRKNSDTQQWQPNWPATIKIYLTLAFLVLFVFSSRIFCKTFCPIGAMMAVFNYFSLGKVKLPPKCIRCNRCSNECPTDCQPMTRIAANIPPSRCGECVLCNKCRDVCPVVRKEANEAKTGV